MASRSTDYDVKWEIPDQDSLLFQPVTEQLPQDVRLLCERPLQDFRSLIDPESVECEAEEGDILVSATFFQKNGELRVVSTGLKTSEGDC